MATVTKLRAVEPRPAKAPILAENLSGIVHLLTCGSVDDGKSTLIGRLLWDASDLFDDQRAMLEKSERRAAHTDLPDFSLLVDGLAAEREQGITIDIAWRYFDTHTRRFVIIDSPGHEQYTRNMASGASHADVAIMLIDARSGIKTQTRRHAAILDLVGVKRVILAVNKMDLVDWSEDVFRHIEADFRKLSAKFGFWESSAIPVSAVFGDNIATSSASMRWYKGDTLLTTLEKLPTRGSNDKGAFRMPVQTVVRDGRDFRGLAGTVSSGIVKVGDRVGDALSGKTAVVKRIAQMGRDLTEARAGQAVAIQLDVDLDIARGAVIADPAHKPAAAHGLEAKLVWLSEQGFDPRAGYLLRTATDLVPVSSMEIKAHLDLESMTARSATAAVVNDIAVAKINLGRAAALDMFSNFTETGSVLIVDAISGASLAAGVVTSVSATMEKPDGAQFLLTRELLSRGLNRDLGNSYADREEFQRRTNEVALLLRAAGVPVAIEAPPPEDDGMDPGL